MSDEEPKGAEPKGERIAKVMARAGIASRRDAEKMVIEGRVTVNGVKAESPALDVLPSDRVTLDGKPIDAPQAARLWLYYKPVGLVTSAKDEKGRQTVFDTMPEGMPRVMSVGRLDLTSEGLLLLTNDGELKRKLELPTTGWLRKYRVRVNGRPNEATFDPLRRGMTIDGEDFQPMEVSLDKQQGANAWLTVGIREGKNREIRRAMTEVGLTVNRLIRVSYGPFRLNTMKPGDVVEVKQRVLREQLGTGGETDAEGKPERKPRGRPADKGGDRPARSFGAKSHGARSDRPRPSRGEDGDRRPARGGKPAGDRKPYAGGTRSGEERPRPRPVRADEGGEARADRPYRAKPREDGDRKPYGKPAGDRKPYGKPREDGDQPRTPRERTADGERPFRAGKPAGERKPYAGKPAGDRKPYGKPREEGDRPRAPRERTEDGERPFRASKPAGDRKPYAGTPAGDRKPYGKPREDGDRPRAPHERTADGERPFRAAKPAGDRKPYAGKPSGDRKPYAGKPREGGDRPQRSGPGSKPGGPRKGPPRKG
ncbi:MAG TPA: pseudouridine synthase [Albidovulum sp.]|uniref:pseudouridine synthase n=1 Tax=Albidovulum sp. TaxID=1872424 RepID=UPI002C6F33F7|nr:pseudouridine synthase [Albidovulum sp.]